MRLGADAVIEGRPDLPERVRSEFGPIDVFIDAAGRDVFQLGFDILDRGGTYVAYGVPDGEVRFNGTRWFFGGIKLVRGRSAARKRS